MHADYYRNTLYPLQDNVLDIVAQSNNSFYLTGGTALGRAWLHHRYSDDLDFFVNDDEYYKERVEQVYQSIMDSGLGVERVSVSDHFFRCLILDDSTRLKVDFVNDTGFRMGHPVETSLFIRTDNAPDRSDFQNWLHVLIDEIVRGNDNSLYSP